MKQHEHWRRFFVKGSRKQGARIFLFKMVFVRVFARMTNAVLCPSDEQILSRYPLPRKVGISDTSTVCLSVRSIAISSQGQRLA